MTTKIKIISPVLFAAGESLDGEMLSASKWIMQGEAIVADDRATTLERDGYADIVSRDGEAVTWPSCCAGSSHDH